MTVVLKLFELNWNLFYLTAVKSLRVKNQQSAPAPMQIPCMQLIPSACWSLERPSSFRCSPRCCASPDATVCVIFPAFFISSVSGGKLSDAPSHAERCTSPVPSSLSGPARRQTIVIINCTLLRGLLPALSASAQLFKGSLHCRPLPATALERERERESMKGGREREGW